MNDHSERGFSLIELAIVVAVLGIVFAFSVPSFHRLSESYQLKSAAQNVAGQLRLAREKAIATGIQQPMHIPNNVTYHIHYPTGIATIWTLPDGITFSSATVGHWFHLDPDGHSEDSGLIVLMDTRGNRDTVSVQLSGLILSQ